MSELLIEIFSEEIPARMQLQAQSDFKVLWKSALDKKNASFGSVETYVAPQRLVICVIGLEPMTKGTNETRRGPKTNAPEAALTGFLKSTGKTKDQLTEKDGYWYAEISESGKKITEFLPEMLDEVVDAMPWPKTMRWYNHQTKIMSKPWIRPVRSILCVYDSKPVNFNVAGFGVDTGGVTYGHRFLAPGVLTITSFADYKKQLEKSFVILDHLERQTMIKKMISDQAAAKGFKLKEDQGLLEEVAGLIDCPFAHLGKIEEKFMHLPDVVLSTSMKVHQKYFTIVDKDDQIAPFFGVVTNVPGKAGDSVMLDGLERVLRARLADASFFYEGDLKNGLESLVSKLDHIIFHAKLGTLGQKVQRLIELMPSTDGKRAALLCKADLVTEMVGEFPELQGIMGEIYGKTMGEKHEVAAALREYYRPLGPSERCPTASISVELALWDKLDTLVGFIGLAEIKPTGSKDPFGLRRSALGVIRLIIENNLQDRFIKNMIHKSIKSYEDQFGREFISKNPQNPIEVNVRFIEQEVTEFIYDRLKVYLRDQGMEHDYVEAVLLTTDNLWSVAERASALQNFLNTDAGVSLKAAYKRASGILSKTSDLSLSSSAPTMSSSDLFRGSIDSRNKCENDRIHINLLKESAEEKYLYDSLKSVEIRYHERDYEGSMSHLSELRDPIDAFFDKVTVNCEDQALKENRYALLNKFVTLVNQVADFSKLQG